MNLFCSVTLCLRASVLRRVMLVVGMGLAFCWMFDNTVAAELPTPTLKSPFVAVDLQEGETAEVTLTNGQKVTLKLIAVKDFRDSLRGAVRRSEVKVEVGGKAVTLGSATYHLPV